MQRFAVVAVTALGMLSTACASRGGASDGATGPGTETSAGAPQPYVAGEPWPEPAPHAAAAEAPSDSGAGAGWYRFSIAPYIWAPSVDASFSGGGSGRSGVEGDGEFPDSNDLSGSIHGEFGLGPVTAFGDVTYLSSRTDGSASVTLPRGGAPLDVDLRTQLDVWLVEAGAALRVFQLGEGSRSVPFEVLGGARLNSVSFDTDVEASRGGSTAGFSGDVDGDWVDPFVGVRTRIPLSDSFSITARGDIGGTSGSDNAVNAIATLDWAISRTFSAVLGWRYYSVERDLGSDDIDITLSGPMLGLVIRF